MYVSIAFSGIDHLSFHSSIFNKVSALHAHSTKIVFFFKKKKNRLMGVCQLLQKQVHGQNPVCFSGLTSNGFTTSPSKVQVLLMAKVITGGLLLLLPKLLSLRLVCQPYNIATSLLTKAHVFSACTHVDIVISINYRNTITP